MLMTIDREKPSKQDEPGFVEKLLCMMSRLAAFAAHAAARETNNQAAKFAARAAGQAASTAHVASHAVHAASYAAKAVFYSSNLNQAYTNTVKERQWQLEHLLDLEKAT
jgi:hypothetical protein